MAARPYSWRDDPRVPAFADERPVIVFDGECVLCSRFAQFVIRHDPEKCFRLLPAQSQLGRALYEHFGQNPAEYETNILIEDGVAWFKSESSIRICERLGWPWSWLRVARALPLSWRERAYEVVARNRFRMFGRRETCFVPTADIRERFLQ